MSGEVVSIFIAATATGPMREVAEATAVAGAGLVGDRYHAGAGTYSQTPGGGRHLTLIEQESLDAIAAEHGVHLAPGESRRNITTRGIRLNDLVGKRFTIGEVLCEGVRLCPPCNHLEQLTGKPVLGPLVHRGGLRAHILSDGVIRRGDTIREVEDEKMVGTAGVGQAATSASPATARPANSDHCQRDRQDRLPKGEGDLECER